MRTDFVTHLQAVRDIWADRRYAKLSTERKREYLVSKATKGSAFMLDHEAYRLQLEAYREAAKVVEP
jgi:hypothetical protein